METSNTRSGTAMTASLKDIFRQASIGQSRSSVLNPLQWTLVILTGGIAVFWIEHVPNWLIVLLAIMLSADGAIFFVAYLYFMFTKPDEIGSETFRLKRHEQTMRLFTPHLVKLIDMREAEIEAGRYVDISNLGDAIKKNEQMKAGQEAATPPKGKKKV
jgi:hypothetical protein